MFRLPDWETDVISWVSWTRTPSLLAPSAQIQAPAQLDFTVYEIPISCLSSTMSLRSFRPELALGPPLRQKMYRTFFAKLMISKGCWLSVCPGGEPVRDCQSNYHRLWRSSDNQQRQNLSKDTPQTIRYSVTFDSCKLINKIVNRWRYFNIYFKPYEAILTLTSWSFLFHFSWFWFSI